MKFTCLSFAVALCGCVSDNQAALNRDEPVAGKTDDRYGISAANCPPGYVPQTQSASPPSMTFGSAVVLCVPINNFSH